MTANNSISSIFMHNVSRIQNQSIVGANPCVRPARMVFLEMNQLDLIKMIQREFQIISSHRANTRFYENQNHMQTSVRLATQCPDYKEQICKI